MRKGFNRSRAAGCRNHTNAPGAAGRRLRANTHRNLRRSTKVLIRLNPAVYRPCRRPQAESLWIRGECPELLHLHHPQCPRAAGPPTGRSPLFALPSQLSPKSHVFERTGQAALVCSEPIHLLIGTAADAGQVRRFRSVIEPRQFGGLSADAARGDNSTGRGAACGNAERAAAARYEGERRNCCRFPVEYPARGANARARDIPESNTAPSSRADIASLFPRSHGRPAESERKCRQAGGTNHAPSNWRDCAPWALVCQVEYILLVGVRMPTDTEPSMEQRGRPGNYFAAGGLSVLAVSTLDCRSASCFSAVATSSSLSSISAFSLASAAAPALSAA
jgi:hypothetical protein